MYVSESTTAGEGEGGRDGYRDKVLESRESIEEVVKMEAGRRMEKAGKGQARARNASDTESRKRGNDAMLQKVRAVQSIAHKKRAPY
jgi:hypothetical protein